MRENSIKELWPAKEDEQILTEKMQSIWKN